MVDLVKKTKEIRRVFAEVNEDRQYRREQATIAFCGRIGMDFSRMTSVIIELEKALSHGTPIQGWRVDTESVIYNDHLTTMVDENHHIAVYDDGTLVIQYPIQQNFQPYGGIGLTDKNIEEIESAAIEWLRKNKFRNVILSMRSITDNLIYLDDNNVLHTGDAAESQIRKIIYRLP